MIPIYFVSNFLSNLYDFSIALTVSDSDKNDPKIISQHKL